MFQLFKSLTKPLKIFITTFVDSMINGTGGATF